MYKLGERSSRNLAGVNPCLQLWVNELIKVSPVDFGILDNGGFRTANEQHQLYLDGKSKCDGYKKESYHQSRMAVDLVPYIDGKFTWSDRKAFIFLYNKGNEVWEMLKCENRIFKELHLRWGGFWLWKDFNNNGKLDLPKEIGWDAAHWELRSKEQRF